MNDNLGKKAEHKLRIWLDRPDIGQSFDRIYDQMSGFYGGRNICDFTLFKSPYMFYIESKATTHDRFDFSMLTDTQYQGLLSKSKIQNVFGVVIVLFYEYKRAFVFNIVDINKLYQLGKKSLNINKISRWNIPYYEIPTISSRKELLDYNGNVEDIIKSLSNL